MATKDQKEILERIESLEKKIDELLQKLTNPVIPNFPSPQPNQPQPMTPWGERPPFESPIKWEAGAATQTVANFDRFSVEIDSAKRIQGRLEEEED